MLEELFSLKGRKAVVTGASRGLGRAVAVAFASCGADVALMARTEEGLAETAHEAQRHGASTLELPADVSDSAQVSRAFKKIREEWERRPD